MRKGRKPGQHAEKKTSVARSEKRTRKHPSARQENNLRGKDGATANEAPTRKPSNQAPWNGVRHGQRSPPQETEQTTEGERMEHQTPKAPPGSPHDAPRGNGWSNGQRRPQQDAEKTSEGERMDTRITKDPAGRRTKHRGGTACATANEAPRRKPHEAPRGNGVRQGQRRIYVERIEIRIEKNSLNDMFLSIFSGRMPNNALQRTPLAWPLSWARC